MKPHKPIEADRQRAHDRGGDAKTQCGQSVSQRAWRRATWATAIAGDLMNLQARFEALRIDPGRGELGGREVFVEVVMMTVSIVTITSLTLFSLGLSAYPLIVP